MSASDRDRGPATARKSSLREVRAAQLRAVALRWAIGKSALGTLFLIGALSHALGPAPRAQDTTLWMALLVVLSTFHVGLGLRTFARVRRKAARLWLPATLAWGLLATVLLRILGTR
jgi:hypothetical protein